MTKANVGEYVKKTVDEVILDLLHQWTRKHLADSRNWYRDSRADTLFIDLPAPDFQPYPHLINKNGRWERTEHSGEYPASPLGLRLKLHELMKEQGFLVPVIHAERFTTTFEKRESNRWYPPEHLFHKMGEPVSQTKETIPVDKIDQNTINNSFTEALRIETDNTVSSHLFSIPPEPNKAFFNAKEPYVQFQVDHPSQHLQNNGYPHTHIRVYSNNPHKVNIALQNCLVRMEEKRTSEALQNASAMNLEVVAKLVKDTNDPNLLKSQREIIELVQPFFTAFYKQLGIFYYDKLKENIFTQHVHGSFEIPIGALTEDQGFDLLTNLRDAQKEAQIENAVFHYNRSQKVITWVINGATLDSLEPRGELKNAFYTCVVQNTDEKKGFVAKIDKNKDVPKYYEFFFDDFYEHLTKVYTKALDSQATPKNLVIEGDSSQEGTLNFSFTSASSPVTVTISSSPQNNEGKPTPSKRFTGSDSPKQGTSPTVVPLSSTPPKSSLKPTDTTKTTVSTLPTSELVRRTSSPRTSPREEFPQTATDTSNPSKSFTDSDSGSGQGTNPKTASSTPPKQPLKADTKTHMPIIALNANSTETWIRRTSSHRISPRNPVTPPSKSVTGSESGSGQGTSPVLITAKEKSYLVTDNFSVPIESLSQKQINSIFDNLAKAQEGTTIQGISFRHNEAHQTIDVTIKDVPVELLEPKGHLRDAFYQIVLDTTKLQKGTHGTSQGASSEHRQNRVNKKGKGEEGCYIS